MKKYLLVLAALTLQLSCQPESNSGDIDNGNKPEEEPVFCLADISDYTDAFDKVICTDEAHVLFTKYYDSGLVEEYFWVCEQDTVALFFDVSGVPKLLTTGKNHILFGNFSENSALIGIADNDGNYTVEDCDFGVNWREYIEAISSRRTKADNGRDNLLEHVQSNVVENILTFGAGITPGFMNPLWVAEALAYMISDNPVYQVVTSFSFNSLNVYLTVAGFGALAGGLLLADVWLIRHNLSLIWNGIKNGDFSRLPFAKAPELFAKIIECGVWFGAGSEATLDWQAQQGSVPIKIGVPNFDYNDPLSFEIGVKKGITLPEGWSAEVVGSGLSYTLNYSISANLGKNVITGDIPVYVTGVSNIDEDLVFTIHQAPQIQLNPEVVYFSDMNPQTVQVTSLTKENWEVIAWPDWINYQVNRIATQETNSITLTPKTLKGVSPTALVLSVTTSDGRSNYEITLPIYPYGEEDVAEQELRKKLIKFFYDTGGEKTWYNWSNWCSDRPLEEWYGVSKTDKGWELYLDRNGLVGFGDLSGCTTLTNISCSSTIPGVVYYRGAENKLKTFDVSGCTALENFVCGYAETELIDVSGCTNLKFLDCSGNRLQYIPNIDDCTSLADLLCSNNLIEDLSLSNHPSLRYLSCNENPLRSSVTVNNCPLLESISFNRGGPNDGNVKTVDINNCPSLLGVDYNGHPLESLSIRNCASILFPVGEYFIIPTTIKKLDFTGCTAMIRLLIHGKKLQVQSVNVSNCSSLQDFDCAYNKISSINVSGCKALRFLYCNSNLLTSIDVSDCPNLIWLECDGNHIKQQITDEYRINHFTYDVRYEYQTVWDEASQQNRVKYTDHGYGWWYPGEPEKGYHGR